MTQPIRFAEPRGKLVMIGCGSIGQAVMPLLDRHLGIRGERLIVVTADQRGHGVAEEHGGRFHEVQLTRANLDDTLSPLLEPGDVLLNLSVDVSSVALIRLAAARRAIYLDTCIEPWAGGYTDPALSPSQRSNYALRESALALRAEHGKGTPTAVVAHGANPGLVSHFVKQAGLTIARDLGHDVTIPTDREGWARLFATLGIKVVHIAEHDTQVASHPKQAEEFVNTWSIDGFVGEGCQPAECGFGTHEKALPTEGRRHEFGCDAAIYLLRPGAGTRVRTWTPQGGPCHGFMITHNESISIADYLTLREAGRVVYRPTVHYAYHPCDDAVLSVHELAGRNWRMQPRQRLLMDEIVAGIDELGVLLAGHGRNAFWYGSQLSTDEARRLAPHNSATSLQVAAGVLGGLVWAIENPEEGVVEADDLDFARVLEVARPYLGPMTGAYTDWTPLLDRGRLFPEDLDHDDPWQLKNVLVR